MLLGLGLADAVVLIGVYVARLLNGGLPSKSQLWMNHVTFGKSIPELSCLKAPVFHLAIVPQL